MKRLALLFVLFTSPLFASDFLGTVEDEVLNQTVLINLIEDGNKVGSGSGTLVFAKFNEEENLYIYKLITCEHVMNPPVPYNDIVIINHIRDERGEIIANLNINMSDSQVKFFSVKSDEEHDFSMITIKVTWNLFVTSTPARVLDRDRLKEKVSVGTKLIMAGCAFGLPPVAIDTKVIMIDDFTIIAERKTIGGMSGGGVYTKNGELVGIISFSLDRGYDSDFGGLIMLDELEELFYNEIE